MKEHILGLIDRCLDIHPDDCDYWHECFEQVIDECGVNERYLPDINEKDFNLVELLWEFLALEKDRWWKHYDTTGQMHWTIASNVWGVFCHTFVRGALLDRKQYLISSSSNINRLFFIDDGYSHSTCFNNHIYDKSSDFPYWSRLALPFHRKFQSLHRYVSSQLSLKDRQIVYWYFSVLLLVVEAMECWKRKAGVGIYESCQSSSLLSLYDEQWMMHQYLILRFSQSFYLEQYLAQSIDGHWSASTRNNPLNRVWNKASSKHDNLRDHFYRVHPEVFSFDSFIDDPIVAQIQRNRALLLID